MLSNEISYVIEQVINRSVRLFNNLLSQMIECNGIYKIKVKQEGELQNIFKLWFLRKIH
jgi:hypothetical protein